MNLKWLVKVLKEQSKNGMIRIEINFQIYQKNSNNYYIKNKDKVKERNVARYKFGTEFYLMCNMYTNLIE